METNPDLSNCHEHHNCTASHSSSSVSQTLDEMDFERGIWYAAQTGDIGRVKYLLETKGISPNVKDMSGYAALHYASRNGHLNVCKLLIKAGADVNATTRAGQATPLHRAANCGQKDIVQLLLGMENGYPCKINVTAKDADGNTALHKAVQEGHENIIHLLVHASPALITIANNKGMLPKDYAKKENIVKLLEDVIG